MKSGIRIGNWFLWFDVETVETTNSDRSLSIITCRNAVTGGDVLAEAIVSKDMAQSLRDLANSIDKHCKLNTDPSANK